MHWDERLTGVMKGKVGYLVSILRSDGGEQESPALGADALVVVGPVSRGSHRVLCGELEGIYHPHDLVHVAADGCRVVQGELQLLVRAYAANTGVQLDQNLAGI